MPRKIYQLHSYFRAIIFFPWHLILNRLRIRHYTKLLLCIHISGVHCNCPKLMKNFANYLLKKKMCFVVLKCYKCLGLQKKTNIEGKLKPKGLRHFKVHPVLQIDTILHGRLNLCSNTTITERKEELNLPPLNFRCMRYLQVY